jgi:hypothetical protein
MIAVAWASPGMEGISHRGRGAGFASVDAMIAVTSVSPGMERISHRGETRPYTRRAS